MSDLNHIFGWLRLDERLTTSGQPTEDQLAQLKAIGVTHVINLCLHTHERALSDEAASVAALGMTYIHIPVEFEAPTEADFVQFSETMGKLKNATVHVHCVVNARVSAFLYRYRRDVLGMDEVKARDAMETIWKPGGVWAAFIGDESSIRLAHRPGRMATDRSA